MRSGFDFGWSDVVFQQPARALPSSKHNCQKKAGFCARCCKLGEMRARRPLSILVWILLFLFFMNAPVARSQYLSFTKSKLFLRSGWKFRQVGTATWYPATIPGCVHTDLMNNKLIEDPFYRDNEQKLQWIGKTDWEYQTSFSVGPEIVKRQHIELVFAGLDTYADVFLNEAPLLNANNMFREWRVSEEGVSPGRSAR